jgi:hypothetical protein
MAFGKKTIKGAEKGDILIAKSTVSAYEKPNDYSSVQLHFLAGQELGTIEDFVLIDTHTTLKMKFIIFKNSYDDGFGNMVDSTFSLPENTDLLEFKANSAFEYPDIYKNEYPNANQTKKIVDDSETELNDWGSSVKNTGIRGASVSKQSDTDSSNILGFTPTVFFSGLAGLFILIIGAYLILKSEPAPPPQQSTQTLSGVESENNKFTIPKMDFIKV